MLRDETLEPPDIAEIVLLSIDMKTHYSETTRLAGMACRSIEGARQYLPLPRPEPWQFEESTRRSTD